MYIPFDKMPLHSRIWVYQADRKFSPTEKDFIVEQLTQFCEHWNTHGAKMPSSFDIKFNQIIVLAVDESQLSASGCSIDSSVRTLRKIENHLQINLLDQGKLAYVKANQELEVMPALSVKSKILEGKILEETLILNPLVKDIAGLSKDWKINAKESWLKKFFPN
jgi:hypothetical protein